MSRHDSREREGERSQKLQNSLLVWFIESKAVGGSVKNPKNK